MEELPVIFQFFSTYGYFALAIGILFFGDATLLAAGFFSQFGYFNIFLVIFLAVILLPVYDAIFYWLGLTGRKAVLLKKFSQEKLGRVERFFKRHGPKTLLSFRFAFGLRTIFLLVVGMAKMPFLKFYAFDIAGTAFWAGTLCALGYFFGQAWDQLKLYLRNIGLAITILVVLVILVLLLLTRIRKWNSFKIL